MCGIAGIVSDRPMDLQDGILQEVSRRLLHRGPDDQGALRYRRGALWKGRGLGEGPFEVFLLHHRLSIIDLAETGWQPMSTPDDRYHIVFNGEIYNYVELRRELERAGFRFVSTSDTEVLLAACRHWRDRVFERLTGMYAFVLLDTVERSLLLARDPFGIKPLYFARVPLGFAFASEIPPLLALPGLRRRVCPERLYTYLRYGHTDYGDATLYDGIRQLPAACVLRLSLDAPHEAAISRYWRPSLRGVSRLEPREAAERFRDLFLDSVRIHMRSDVPVGSALSGGLDSSAVVMSMRRLGGSSLRIRAFSYIADDPRYDEERWVDCVVRDSGAVVHKLRIRPEEVRDDLDRLIRAQAEPFVSTSMYAQYRVFQLARACGIKVMLDGQGADEVLCGYPQHLAARLAGLVFRGRALELLAYLQSVHRLRGSWDILWKSGQFLIPPAFQGPFRRAIGEPLEPDWMDGAWFRARGVAPAPLRAYHARDPLRHEMASALVETTLPMLLRFEDRNSMTHSIESRVPFLTTRLVEFLLGLPDDYLIGRDGTTKLIFRRAMRGILPRPIAERKDKIGFATPQARWLRHLLSRVRDQVRDLLPCFREVPLRALLRDEAALDRHSLVLWRILNAHLWARAFNVSFN